MSTHIYNSHTHNLTNFTEYNNNVIQLTIHNIVYTAYYTSVQTMTRVINSPYCNNESLSSKGSRNWLLSDSLFTETIDRVTRRTLGVLSIFSYSL